VLDEHVLQDVGRIDPRVNAIIQPELDHPPKPVAVTIKQFSNRGRVAVGGAVEQRVDAWRRIRSRGHAPIKGGIPYKMQPQFCNGSFGKSSFTRDVGWAVGSLATEGPPFGCRFQSGAVGLRSLSSLRPTLQGTGLETQQERDEVLLLFVTQFQFQNQ